MKKIIFLSLLLCSQVFALREDCSNDSSEEMHQEKNIDMHNHKTITKFIKSDESFKNLSNENKNDLIKEMSSYFIQFYRIKQLKGQQNNQYPTNAHDSHIQKLSTELNDIKEKINNVYQEIGIENPKERLESDLNHLNETIMKKKKKK